MNVDTEWNSSLEKTILDISEKCKLYRTYFEQASKKQGLRYGILMYTIIVVSPISGILSTLSDSYSSMSIIITILSFFTGILSAIVKFSKFDQKASLYKSFSLKFGALENNITRQLTLRVEDRQTAGSYAEFIFKSYDVLYANMPSTTFNSGMVNIIPSISEEKNIILPVQKKDDEKVTPDTVQFSDPFMQYEMKRLNSHTMDK